MVTLRTTYCNITQLCNLYTPHIYVFCNIQAINSDYFFIYLQPIRFSCGHGVLCEVRSEVLSMTQLNVAVVSTAADRFERGTVLRGQRGTAVPARSLLSACVTPTTLDTHPPTHTASSKPLSQHLQAKRAWVNCRHKPMVHREAARHRTTSVVTAQRADTKYS